MNAVVTERLVDIARAAAAAGWGRATAIYDAAARELGISRQTLLRKLKDVQIKAPRKRRADAGRVTLTRAEAERIAAVVEETRRLTGTGTVPVDQAVELLRANGKIVAGRIDEETGEFFPLSISAIRQALRGYGLHPDQLSQPTPAASLSSPHPNWCWQVDASVSRQYYLADEGAAVMPRAEYYRGKPQNFQRISDRRIWRYVVTDHCTGCLSVFYVLGSETTGNLLDALIHAIVPHADGTMHGVPHIIMTDPGSAMTSSPTRNFCSALDIELLINERGNARAKGQVENAQYLVETHFEATLKLSAPTTSIDEINARAQRWSKMWNSTRIHSRTGLTRRDAWLRITPEQLVLAPSAETLRELAVSAPKACTVRDHRIKYRGKAYDVSGVPGLIQGQRVDVVLNPFDADSVRVLVDGADGKPAHAVAPEIRRDTWGFLETAAQIGTKYKRPADTVVDENRKALERLAMDATTDAEAIARRKSKAVPFGGAIDPDLPTRNTAVVPHLPRAGTPSEVTAPTIVEAPAPRTTPRVHEVPLLTHTEAAMRLVTLVRGAGGTWSPEFLSQLQRRYADGVPADRLDQVAAELLAPPSVTPLRVVGGAR
jgi:transposase InsO family protein